MAGRLRQVFSESPNVKALRGLMIGLAALVVLAVSGYGTVIYIQLMGKVFPGGPLLMACYMGAFANVVLMLVLLVGKFVWFRPGAHEVASWIVTGVELLVAIFNMMLAFELATGQTLSSLMQAWYYLAPVSPVFSMVGAITLIMTSTELRKRHRELELQEQKDQKEREFDLAMHLAEMDVKHQYLGFIKSKLTAELNAPERHAEMADHAALLVSEVLSGLSGLQSVPRLRGPQVATEQVIDEPLSLADSDEWLRQANARIDHERAQRFGYGASAAEDEQVQGGNGGFAKKK